MVSYRERNGKIEAQVRHVGHKSATKSFKSKAEARAWAAQVEADIARMGKHIQPPPQSLLLADLLKRYAAEISVHKKSCKDEQRRIKFLLRHPITRRGISTLTAKDYADFRDERIKDGTRTATMDLALLRHMYRIAMAEWGLALMANPVAQIRKPKASRGRDRRLIGDEYHRLLEKAKVTDSWFLEPALIFSVETAVRQGELLKAAWNDFDETHRLLTLRDTKNSTDRTIPLSTKAMSVLSALPMTDPRIFPITPEALRSAFKRLCKRLGIVDLNWHDLRHEAVTRLFEKGLTLPEVRLISGHKDIKMLLRYTHLKPSSLLDKLG